MKSVWIKILKAEPAPIENDKILQLIATFVGVWISKLHGILTFPLGLGLQTGRDKGMQGSALIQMISFNILYH